MASKIRKIRIEVTAQELAYIAEALEPFLDSFDTDDPEGRDLLIDLFQRISDRNAKEQGEPPEGY